MEELIRKAIEEQKRMWDADGESYTEKDIRLCVYENMRDNLKFMMSDVAYG